MIHFLTKIILIWFTFTKILEARIECDSTLACEKALRQGSTCVDGFCTNQFITGCLRQIEGPMSYSPRICNSDDSLNTKSSGLCSESSFSYPEIRIAPANWESPMFYAWILQIILSELADVPTSIELSGEGSLNFYDINRGFSYPGTAHNFDALIEGNKVGDCSTTDKPCGHVMPEVWEERKYQWEAALEAGYIDRPSFNGLLGRLGLFTPNFVIKKYPSLISSVGLSGDENRKKLAEIFKRPTTWGYYCQFVSVTNCLENDGTAMRQPQGQDEDESYFVDGQFIGHFRATDESNCTLNPDTCTGNFVDYPCDWIGYTVSQMHWNEIKLETNGPLDADAYSYSHVLQIFQAANRTQSPVIIFWWQPDPMIDAYGFTRISFPQPNLECIGHRPDHNSCGMTKANGKIKKKRFEEVVGDARGSCDYDYARTYQIGVSSLRTSTLSTPEALRSSAYEILQNIYIKVENFDSMLNDWKSGTDAREAVCTWVAKNVDEIKKIIPKGYPRKFQKENMYYTPFLYTAIALGAFVVLSVVITSAMTFYNKDRKEIKNAGLVFLYIILVGFLFVSISSIMYATVPTNASCIARQWIRAIGYTLGLVPLLIKVLAMNKIIQAAENFESINITRKMLLGYVLLSVLIISVFLLIWTLFDPPQRVEEMYLTGENGNIVQTRISCESDSNIWILLVYAWELLQIFCTSVLAFQSRGIREEFNESKELSYLSYTHFFFLMLRTGIYLIPTEALEPIIKEGTTSFLLSFDTFISLCNYFGPKFYAILKDRNTPLTLQSVTYSSNNVA